MNNASTMTLKNMSTEELIAELESRPEITRLNCDLYQQYAIIEQFTENRNSRIISDCVLVRSANHRQEASHE